MPSWMFIMTNEPHAELKCRTVLANDGVYMNILDFLNAFDNYDADQVITIGTLRDTLTQVAFKTVDREVKDD